MHRFFLPARHLREEPFPLPPETAHQIRRVLRLRPGEPVVLFSGDGHEWTAVLHDVGEREVTVRLTERRTPPVELSCRVRVVIALLKGEKPDWIVQKLTELGVESIAFAGTERTVPEVSSERWSRRLERYTRIAQEAAEQSGRVRVPDLRAPRPLEAILAEETRAPRFLLDPEAPLSLAGALRPCPEELEILCGPEGGFSEAEVRLAVERGARPVCLGRRVLRAETAALAAAAIVMAAAEG